MTGLLPQGTLYVYTNDPFEIGVMFLPNGFGQLFTTAIMPLFLHYTKRPKYYIIVALVVQTLFNALYAYGISFHKSAWIAFQFFGQGCFGLITIVTVMNVGLHVRPSELGVAVGLLGTFRSMEAVLGLPFSAPYYAQLLTRNWRDVFLLPHRRMALVGTFHN